MPNVKSWNGRWSGDGKLFARVKSFGGKKATETAVNILKKGYFRYDFGDGWSAGVGVKKIDKTEAARIRRKSVGFSGYDWMIESIILRGEIKPRNNNGSRTILST